MKKVCVYHSRDLDGWMSAAIVKHYSMINNEPPIIYIGYDYGQPIPNLDEYDKVIMCDVSFSKELILELKTTKDLVWIDHHISAIQDVYGKDKWLPSTTDINGIQNTKFAACELTWQYFFPNENIPEIVRLLGRYDCFGHKGTNEEFKVLEFQYGARQSISNYEEAYEYLTSNIKLGNSLCDEIWYQGKAIYEYLCTEAKQIYNRTFSIDFILKEENENGGGGSITYNFIGVNQDRFNPVNFGIDYHRDNYDGFACFWFTNGKWNFSLYNDNGKVDCSLIAKQYGGGGHKGAAGFVTVDLKSIIGV
jgi:oligoribonuclease NrnB/cAMP/cGMP phosphodiesterase (DHH superfamily)